jgi:hypothetical protein
MTMSNSHIQSGIYPKIIPSHYNHCRSNLNGNLENQWIYLVSICYITLLLRNQINQSNYLLFLNTVLLENNELERTWKKAAVA